MKKAIKPRDNNVVDYWQSATDLLLALLLVLLLVIALLLLYLMQLPDQSFNELWGTQPNPLVGMTEMNEHGTSWEPHVEDPDEEHGDGDGGGGSGRYEEDEFHFEYPIPSAGGGFGDEWGKAAVYVTVVDGETKRAIREEGVTFELYQVYNQSRNVDYLEHPELLHGAIRYLNTYYPKKVEYRNFKTTEEGVYYLPEKIEEGGYYFREITEPKGYDASDVIYYEIDKNYDWNDPYVVSVPLFPSKNFVRARLLDSETGEEIYDGSFQVHAEGDVITADETVRYVDGERADVFRVTDKELGYAESKGLYLGTYKLSQNAAPRYYTTVPDVVEVEVKKKNGLEPEVHEFFCEKTAINLHLVDDLFANMDLEGASFILTGENVETKRATTDTAGSIVFTNLEKNVTYHLRQETAPEGYQLDKREYTFFVDTTGHIEGEAKSSLVLTNFVPRVAIGLNDILLKGSVADKNLSLYDSNGTLIRTWNTSGKDEVIQNLPQGSYYILINNKESSRYDFVVENSNGITNINYEIWTLQGILTLAGAIVLIPLVIYFVVILLARLLGSRGKKKSTDKEA